MATAKTHQIPKNTVTPIVPKEAPNPIVSEVGENITATVVGHKLTLEIDLSKDFGPSTSGKTMIIATSSGNVKIPGAARGATLGLNLYYRP
jgi:hypothetical protein